MYALNENAKSVRLVSVNPPRLGSLAVGESAYQLDFPEDTNSFLLRVEINRFSAKAVRELGRPPRDKANVLKLETLQHLGECQRLKGGAL